MPLTVAQINHWARIFDALKDQEGIQDPAAVAWATWDKQYKIVGNEWVRRQSAELQEGFVPPPSGEAPEAVQDILQDVYTSCRLRWVEEHPDDKENAENKESCAKIAWNVVKEAGWSKDEEGKWRKAGENNED